MSVSHETDSTLIAASTDGNAQAQFDTAKRYETGDGGVRDDELAIRWYEKAANQGYAEAKIAIERLKDEGRDVRGVLKAAEMGFASSQFTLGMMYLEGKGVRADHEKAMHWLEKASAKGFAKAQLELGKQTSKQNNFSSINPLLAAGRDQLLNAAANGEKDAEAILMYSMGEFKYLETLAERGIQDCQFRLGEWLYERSNSSKNFEQAHYWLDQAAYHHDRQHAGAIYFIGEIHQMLGNEKEANRLKNLAAEQGWPEAQYWKALKCNADQNFRDRFFWAKLAADNGHILAMDMIAESYCYGKGVQPSSAFELYWVKKGLERDSVDAQYHFGKLHECGRGVNQSHVEAVYWYRKAADREHPYAQYCLAKCYLKGVGVEPNRDTAKLYLKRAIQGKLDIAFCTLSELEREDKAIAEQNAIAEKIARELELQKSIPPVVQTVSGVFRPEGLIHKTIRGEKVRSKSEVVIANLLHMSGLDYEYECDLAKFGYKRAVCPDFVFQSEDGIIIWEHLGKLDDAAYKARWEAKLDWYCAAGFDLDKNLFISTESPSEGVDSAALLQTVDQIKRLVGTQKATKRPAKKRTLASQSLVFFDFETTGLNASKGDHVIDVGAVKVTNGRIVKSFESLVAPGFLISNEISKLTNISNEMLLDAPRAETVMRELHSFIEGSVLVAHNATFDAKFLRTEFVRVGLPTPEHDVLCTMKLAKRIVPSLSSYRLEALSSHFQLPGNKNAHRALPDAKQAAKLWQALENSLLAQNQIERISIPMMLELQDIPIKEAKKFLKQYRS